ncbi:DUF6009 family protein [Streptomyces tropicalis]|uniref:DUF6009 family protein n=1 Tax=Streptomyces tropicalis TaxID=3034234 RepID=A0ABT6A8D5_9ACTN|nr:DUF6009 family protein [Streptomyces tropicalis]MDF3300901.1 DUF6009 family protein [Streptomyces tropicalis]
MSSLLAEGDLSDEVELVWLEDLDKLDYVRQALDKLLRKQGVPTYARAGRLIGYATLSAAADTAAPDSCFYRRRVFFLLEHDRDSQPDGPYKVAAPSEAVDPRTLAPGKVGAKTERSQNRVQSARPMHTDVPVAPTV